MPDAVSQPLVSVVVPTFNRAYCLPAALHSVFTQTYGNLEAIVVDDGSSDDTEAVLTRCFEGEPRLRYFWQTNRGVAAARNTGLHHAHGEYIAFLDSDDWWMPWKIELQLACLAKVPEAGMVWTDMDAVDAEGRLLNARYLRVMYHAYRRFSLDAIFERSWPLPELLGAASPAADAGRLYVGDIFSPMLTGNLVHTSTVLLQRRRLAAVGGFNEALQPSGEDFDFHLRTSRCGPVAFADVATIRYRVGGADQLTQPRYRAHMARSFLATVEPAIRAERRRIRLPPGMLRRTLAHGYAWLGEAQLDDGDARMARRALFRSLRYRPQWRVAVLAVLACFPLAVGHGLRRGYARFKARFGRGVEEPQ